MQDKRYAVYMYGQYEDTFESFEDAIDYAEFLCDVYGCEIVELNEDDIPKPIRSV